MTPLEFIKLAEKRNYTLFAIKKEFPGKRWMLLGFEYSKRSSKRRYKWIMSNPQPCDPPTKESHHVTSIT